MSEIERIEKIRFFFKKNKKDFSAILGHKYAQNYTSFLSGKTRLTLNMIKALKLHCESINVNWLLWGQGSMLLPQAAAIGNKVINGDHNQSTITGNITNGNTPLSDKKHIKLLEERIKDKEYTIKTLQESSKERIKDKEYTIKTLQELLKSKEININLHADCITNLKKEIAVLQEKLKQ